MKIYCINFCMVISWVAVITLSIFWWVSKSEPILLEITSGLEKKASETLFLSAAIYLVIALLVSAYRGIFVRGETVSEGVERLKNDMRRVIRAGETHNTPRQEVRKNSSDSVEPKVASLGMGIHSSEEEGLDTTQRSEDHQNLLG